MNPVTTLRPERSITMRQVNPFRAVQNSRLLSVSVGLAVALMAMPVRAALDVPKVPLQSGDAVAPNVWFILDDSGSMSRDGGTFMRNPSVPQVSGGEDDITGETFTSNVIYYNPSKTYLPWKKFDGTYFDSTPYSAAYSDLDLADTTVNLGLNNRTFYVPKPTATDLSDTTQYYRWRFLTDGTATRCERTYDATDGGWRWGRDCIAVTSFTWPLANGGTVTRDLAEEKQNYANWYSYHRTRMKVAKAGSSYAFSDLGDEVRVGFTTIHNRNTYPIPVGSDNGRFRDIGASTNRSVWFSRLFGAVGSGRTPLVPALESAGTMFSGTSATGPWGPETGAAQLACRQNFAILTTDGFWNDGSTALGNSDNTAGSEIPNPIGGSYTYSPANPFKDDHSNTLADVAMHYWKTDLRTTLDNIVPTTSSNPAFWQHMVTFGISIGLRGSLDPKTDLPDLTSGAKSWPDPTDAEDIERIDDLWHATVNSRGQFVAASDPDQFTIGLRNALNAIVERTSSGSNVAANTVRLDSETRIFQASYIAGKWTGELASYPISSSGVSTTPDWLGSLGIPAAASRKIFTIYNGAKSTFPHDDQRTALTADVTNYIRGVTTKEQRFPGGTFRNRTHLLGDIINSSPAFVRETNTIFVGANDGMLHAFVAAGADKGKELFAFIPNATTPASLTKLASLSSPTYGHDYFVDGPVVVSSYAESPGKNYLVGTLGRGGKGVYFLDVTNPSTFTETNIIRETAGDADMGFVLGRPLIANLAIGANVSNAVRTPVAIVSNGINSDSGDPALFIYNLATGALIKKIVAQVDNTTTDNGLSTPRGWDVDGDRLLDYVYAGDLKGNVWKFDLSSTKESDWKLHPEGDPFFVAKDGSGNPQPITGSVSVSLDPTTFKPWVFFGTGQYIVKTDLTSIQRQTIYGVKDLGVAVGDRATNLAERKLVASGVIDGRPVRSFEGNAALPADKVGWFVDLAVGAAGPPVVPAERVVSDPFLLGTALVSASIVPSSNPCGGGTGYINAIDAFTGTSLAVPFFDVDGDGSFDDDTLTSSGKELPVGSVNLGIAMPTSPTVVENLLVAGGSSGKTGTVKVNNPLLKGRISWREIIRD